METLAFSRRSDNPICRAYAEAFPSYRKKSLFVTVTESHEPFGYWWDGGSKTTYYACDTFGRNRRPLSVPNGPPPFCKSADGITITPGTMIVTSSIFCGKNGTGHVYLHPADAFVGIEGEAA